VVQVLKLALFFFSGSEDKYIPEKEIKKYLEDHMKHSANRMRH